MPQFLVIQKPKGQLEFNLGNCRMIEGLHADDVVARVHQASKDECFVVVPVLGLVDSKAKEDTSQPGARILRRHSETQRPQGQSAVGPAPNANDNRPPVGGTTVGTPTAQPAPAPAPEPAGPSETVKRRMAAEAANAPQPEPDPDPLPPDPAPVVQPVDPPADPPADDPAPQPQPDPNAGDNNN